MSFVASAEQRKKLEALRHTLKELGCAAVSFSGGVDSTLLMAIAQEQLDERAFAITEVNALYPQRETDEAVAFCKDRGIAHVFMHHDPQAIEGFSANPRNRCYLCKRNLFTAMQAAADEKARELGLIGEGEHIAIAEGSNVTDSLDVRPGAQAVKELGIVSPLEAAKLTKQDIRDLSRELGLPTWKKPSFACLASRFAYGERITDELLRRVDAAEQLLLDAGFTQVRVRVHDDGTLCRVEVLPEDMPRAFAFLQDCGTAQLHSLDFTHVSLDTDGYRTGSMNE